ncbi:MAG: hypothetical protein ACOH18_02155 [Candidatus Saccharimonadaceae bacterium]
MSFYSQLPSLRPLPDPELYAQAHEMTDDLFGKGGSWENVTSQVPLLNRDEVLKSQYLTVAQYGRFLREEELNDQTYVERVPRFLIGKAFAQGFFQQIIPSQLVYSNKYSLANGINVLQVQYAGENFEASQDMADALAKKERIKVLRSHYIYALGAHGLSKVGDVATDYVEKWANDAYPADDRLSRAFSLGHGAMIICAQNFQIGLNDYLLNIARQNVNLDDEAVAIFNAENNEDS